MALSQRTRRAFAALLLLATAAPAADGPALDSWRVETKEWRRPLEGSARVQLTNRWGDVRARAGDGDEMFLRLASQRHRDDPREATVVFEETADGLDVEVRFTEADGIAEQPGWEARRIDLALFLPERLSAAIRTGEGLVELRGLRGEASIETRTGDIRVRALARLSAKSEHGAIHAHFLNTKWEAAVELETVTGQIRVELPSGGNARASIETRGEITTDYSIEVIKQPGKRLKQAGAVIGEGGGPLLRLRSGRGAVRLLESAIPEPDSPPASDP